MYGSGCTHWKSLGRDPFIFTRVQNLRFGKLKVDSSDYRLQISVPKHDSPGEIRNHGPTVSFSLSQLNCCLMNEKC